jgi:hypothetical protein
LTEAIVEKAGAIRNVSHLWISLNEVEAQAYDRLMGLPLERTLAKLDMLHGRVRGKRFPHPVTISRVTDGSERDQAFLSFVRERYPLFKPFMISAGNWTGQVDIATERRYRPVPSALIPLWIARATGCRTS